MKKIMVTGASGFVGGGLVHELRQLGFSVTATGRKPKADESYVAFDLTSEPVGALLDQAEPEAVIHCAGHKNVKWCEENEAASFDLNARVAGDLALASKERGLPYLLVSTDLVFPGDRGGYREQDPVGPVHVYGRSKLEGERLALAAGGVVCRTAGVYGRGSPVFRWLESELAAGKAVEAFVDVRNSPTYIPDLAAMLRGVLERRLSGTYHTCGPESLSRYEWFAAFAAARGYASEKVRPVEAGGNRDEMFLRPDSSLDARETYARLGFRGTTAREAFASGGCP